jgi:hypothetical protein
MHPRPTRRQRRDIRVSGVRGKKKKSTRVEIDSRRVDVYLLTIAVLLLADVNNVPSLNPKIIMRPADRPETD